MNRREYDDPYSGSWRRNEGRSNSFGKRRSFPHSNYSSRDGYGRTGPRNFNIPSSGYHQRRSSDFGGRSRGRGGLKRFQSGGTSRKPFRVDRRKTCPLLLRAFPYDQPDGRNKDGTSSLRKPDEYATEQTLATLKECRLYTWKDATLGELAAMIRNKMDSIHESTEMSFSLVYPDARGRMVMRHIGGKDDKNETLQQLDFQIGDYLDVCCHQTKDA